MKALKEGRLRLAAGNGNGIPIPLPGMASGKGAGKGTNGGGQPTGKLKENVAGQPRIVATGKNGTITADARASKDFLKWAAQGHKESKFKPNGKIQGTRNNNFTELQMNTLGNPDGQYVTGTPLYSQGVTGGRAAENAVNKEQIPAAYRKQVKEYFQSIGAGGK